MTELAVGDVSDMTEEGGEAAVMMVGASSLASTERSPFGSGQVAFADVVEMRLSLVAAGIVSKVVAEGVAECEVTQRLGVMGSEGVVAGPVGVVMSVMAFGVPLAGNSLVLASGMQGLLLGSASLGIVAAAVDLKESVHISVSGGGTVLKWEIEKSVESGTELEAVGKEGGAVAIMPGASGVDGAAIGLGFAGMCVSPSSIWASSFSGVLRPDVVVGGPGLRTGFGSKAGLPADSWSDTLGRI